MTTAQSEFWELGDGACSENWLRPGEQGVTRAADPSARARGGPRCLGRSSVVGKGWVGGSEVFCELSGNARPKSRFSNAFVVVSFCIFF